MISPDKITVNGNVLSGELKVTKQNARFIYRLGNIQEQRYWQSLNKIIDAKVKIKKIEKIKGPRNPGEINFLKYQNHKGIYYSIQLTKISEIKNHRSQNILDKINVLRIHIINHLSKLPKWLRIHSQSLVVGYVKKTDSGFTELLSILGIIHLFSLSGLHVLILLTLVKKITSLMKLTLEWIEIVMLFILPIYGILVGSKSGIWRAVVLAMVTIIAKRLNLKLSKLDIFSITFIICIFVYPYTFLEMGGQLSFLLSFAILYLYQETSYILTIFKMNLVSLPLICYYTYQFNWLILLINIIFIPLFTFFILPVTIISSLTVNWQIWKVFNSVFEVIYSFLEKISQSNYWIFITGKLPLILTIFLVLIAFFYAEKRTFLNQYLIKYLVIFLICIVWNKFPLSGSVNLIDVGQGDSILITTPINRQTILIDVGGKLKFPVPKWAQTLSKNQVENSTIPILKSCGISHIDKLFLTHKDVDHIGNLETLLDKYKVSEVNFGIGLEKNIRIKEAMQKHKEIKFRNLTQGDTFKTGPIKWQVLWPNKFGKGENEDSLTMLANINKINWLFTGDLDSSSEKKILKKYKFRVKFLKVGHHGSKTSTSNELLKAIKPQFGFISAGMNNRYGHPNVETIRRLDKNHVRYFNTAEYGMISWYYSLLNDNDKITTFLKGDLIENTGTKK